MPPFEKASPNQNSLVDSDVDIRIAPGDNYEESARDKEEYIPPCEED